MAKPRPRKPESGGTRYTVTLPPGFEKRLEEITDELEISKSEAFRRALTLFKHAVDADQVLLTKDNEQKSVLVK